MTICFISTCLSLSCVISILPVDIGAIEISALFIAVTSSLLPCVVLSRIALRNIANEVL